MSCRLLILCWILMMNKYLILYLNVSSDFLSSVSFSLDVWYFVLHFLSWSVTTSYHVCHILSCVSDLKMLLLERLHFMNWLGRCLINLVHILGIFSQHEEYNNYLSMGYNFPVVCLLLITQFIISYNNVILELIIQCPSRASVFTHDWTRYVYHRYNISCTESIGSIADSLLSNLRVNLRFWKYFSILSVVCDFPSHDKKSHVLHAGISRNFCYKQKLSFVNDTFNTITSIIS